MADSNLVIGMFGLIILLGAFVLLEFEKLKAESIEYLLAQIIGSVLLAYYAVALGSLPFLILEVFWALFALIELIRNYSKEL
jgi:hypothetical protein